MTSCWLCSKVVNNISRIFFSLQSYVYLKLYVHCLYYFSAWCFHPVYTVLSNWYFAFLKLNKINNAETVKIQKRCAKIFCLQALVLCVCFVDRCLSFCPFTFGHCVVCSFSIYGFWLPLCYLQTLLSELSKNLSPPLVLIEDLLAYFYYIRPLYVGKQSDNIRSSYYYIYIRYCLI
jgi:hypothetical protein